MHPSRKATIQIENPMSKGTDAGPDDLEAVRAIVTALENFQRPDQQRILRWAQEKLGISVATSSGPPAVSNPTAPGAQPGSGVDIRSFIDRKQPSSDNQLTAAIAYYYRFEAPEPARKETITSDDLKEAARAIGQGGRFKKPAQTLINAHQQGLLDRANGGGYTLSNVGENLVAVALGAEGGAVTFRKKPRAKSRGGKKPLRKPRR